MNNQISQQQLDSSIATSNPFKAVYGPVQSWRFGRSLGIDPIGSVSTVSSRQQIAIRSRPDAPLGRDNQRISLSCDRPNITECDRCVLNLLRLQVIQTDENNHTFSQDRQILRQFTQISDYVGAIILAINGQVQLMTRRAEQLLSQYSLPLALPLLPDPLYHWFKHQIIQPTFTENVPSPCLPLHIEQAEKQLLIRLISDPIREQYLLLLEEEELKSFSISSLELLGLTQREAEVLFWVAKDKSNAGIAKMLGCCEGTVRKHLEHLYKKLEVQTRTGAVMVALKKLGLLKQ
jgi:DNA-binding CsgD family transcriptional regulator